MKRSNMLSDMYQGCVTANKRRKNQAIKKGNYKEAMNHHTVELFCKRIRDTVKQQ